MLQRACVRVKKRGYVRLNTGLLSYFTAVSSRSTPSRFFCDLQLHRQPLVLCTQTRQFHLLRRDDLGPRAVERSRIMRFTQLRSVWCEIPSSRATSRMVCPSFTRFTASVLNA